MENDSGTVVRIVVRLPDFDTEGDLPAIPRKLEGRWYENDGRAALVIILKRVTHQLMEGLRCDPDLESVKFKVRLFQWIEGAEGAKLPKMRDILNG